MPVPDSARMLILENVAFSPTGYPVAVMVEELAFLKKAQAEFSQIIWWLNRVGEDSHNVVSTSSRVFLELRQQGLPKHSFDQMKTTIIVGSGYEYREKLEQSLSDVTFEYEVKQNISNMFDEYMDCDVAIGSGGLTASELVASKTPSVLIATYEHQIARCRYFDSVRSVKYIGYRKFDDKELMKAITYPIVPNGQIFFNTKAIINECNAIIQ